MKLDRPLKQQEVDAEKDMLPRVDIVPPAFILAAARGFAFGVWKHGHPPNTNGYVLVDHVKNPPKETR